MKADPIYGQIKKERGFMNKTAKSISILGITTGLICVFCALIFIACSNSLSDYLLLFPKHVVALKEVAIPFFWLSVTFGVFTLILGVAATYIVYSDKE